MTLEIVVLIAIVFALNLAPAFAPPTWTVLVLFGLNSHLPALSLILFGALAAASGRFVLATATGLLRNRISRRTRENLNAVAELVEHNRRGRSVSLLLFALSPFPSAQLFEAAGLLGVRLLPLTFFFFSGRLVSYSIYVTGSVTLKEHGVGELVIDHLKSPWAIAFEIFSLLGIYFMTRIQWREKLGLKHNNRRHNK